MDPTSKLLGGEAGGTGLSSSSPAPPSSSHTVVRRRWLVLFAFCLSSAMSAFLWICFAPVAFFTQAFFGGVSVTAVNTLSLTFLFLFFPGAALSIYVAERYGMRTLLFVGAAGNMLGAWVRYAGAQLALSNPSGGFALVVVGQCIAALVQPIYIDAPARIAGDWFAAHELGLATTLASMANPVGNALGSALPPIFVGSPDDLPSLLLWQAVACTVILLVSVPCIREDAPPEPPSAAAATKLLRRQEQLAALDDDATAKGGAGGAAATTASSAAAPHNQSSPAHAHSARQALAAVTADMRSLLANRNFLVLAWGFGIGLGVFNALLTLIAQILAPCGYDADAAGFAGGALLAAGLIGAGIAGAVLDKTGKYVPMLKTLIAGTVLAVLFMLGSLQPGNPDVAIAAFGVLGLLLIPLLPVSLENAAECTFPVPADTSASFLLGIGQLVGIVAIFALDPLIALPATQRCDTVATPSGGLLLALMVVAGALLLFGFKKDYRRQGSQREGEGEGGQQHGEGV
jgi:FLVCR family MFS transporter 7